MHETILSSGLSTSIPSPSFSPFHGWEASSFNFFDNLSVRASMTGVNTFLRRTDLFFCLGCDLSPLAIMKEAGYSK